MSRLAEYLARLAVLFGNKEHVHFMKVRKGSAIPEIVVDEPAVPKVWARLRLVSTPDAPEDLSRANRDINRMLRDDNASGVLRLKAGANILEFPGRKTPLMEEAVVHEIGELDGVVIRVGGKDETVPVLIDGEQGIFYRCNASREVARKLATFLFGKTIRVMGRGKWRRTQEGEWELETFDIKDYEELDEAPLESAVASLRSLEGSAWNEMDDPQGELKRLRGA